MPCGCGRCLPCRINRRRIWKHRLMLEALKHESACFVTLTYDDEHVPLPNGSLRPSHVRNWLKKVRRARPWSKIRFFLVGEYGGGAEERPHYHAIVFGLHPVVAGGDTGCDGLVRDTWTDDCDEPVGFVYVGDVTPESIQYVCGYTTKKMTSKSDGRLHGRYPEFARMSLRPGIGALAMGDVCDEVVAQPGGLEYIIANEDVPYSLAHGGKSLPLGRYLRRRLRLQLGFGSADAPEAASRKFSAEMSKLLEEAFVDKENHSKSAGKIVVDKNLQKLRSMEARFKIFEQGRKL